MTMFIMQEAASDFWQTEPQEWSRRYVNAYVETGSFGVSVWDGDEFTTLHGAENGSFARWTDDGGPQP